MKTTQGQIFLLPVLKLYFPPLICHLQVHVLAFCDLISFKMECDEYLTMFCLHKKYSEQQFDQMLNNSFIVSTAVLPVSLLLLI